MDKLVGAIMELFVICGMAVLMFRVLSPRADKVGKRVIWERVRKAYQSSTGQWKPLPGGVDGMLGAPYRVKKLIRWRKPDHAGIVHLKIVSNGTYMGTEVRIAETGALVGGIVKLTWTAEYGEKPTAVLTLFNVGVDIIGRAAIDIAASKELNDEVGY
jgi:hypothetical protein